MFILALYWEGQMLNCIERDRCWTVLRETDAELYRESLMPNCIKRASCWTVLGESDAETVLREPDAELYRESQLLNCIERVRCWTVWREPASVRYLGPYQAASVHGRICMYSTVGKQFCTQASSPIVEQYPVSRMDKVKKRVASDES